MPRSDRSPAWAPAAIEKYQLVQEELPPELGTTQAMLAIAEAEEKQLLGGDAGAGETHPPFGRSANGVGADEGRRAALGRGAADGRSGTCRHAAEWLEGDGKRLLGIPDRFDYGVAITAPMGRRILSFGGASYGPTIAGRISG